MLRQINGTNTISHSQNLLRVKQDVTKGECIQCNISRCFSCQQIIATTTFESMQTKEKTNIYHKISCKSNYVIYLLEWLICKTQYIGKTETPFHVKLNNHRKDIKYPLTVEACKHFNYCNHVFHKLEKLILQWNLPIADITNSGHAMNSGQNVKSQMSQFLKNYLPIANTSQ